MQLRRRRTGQGDEPQLLIPQHLLDELLGHLRRSLPQEGCGLLAVRPGERDATAVRFYGGTNVDRSPTRFTMDPRQVLAALMEIDRRGWILGAIVHSHPSGPATPSAVDLAEARYPEALLGIVGLAERPPELRLWRVPATEGEAVVEVGYRVVTSRPASSLRSPNRTSG